VSALFRNNGAIPPCEVFNDVYNADSFLYAYFANFGGGYVSRQVMGAYRVHPGGALSGLDGRQATDHRNTTLWRIPIVMDRRTRAVAYAACLAHALWEDYSWPRRLRQIPYAALMTLVYITPRTAWYLAKRGWLRLARRR
jgi:hypothetical protein